MVRRWLVSESFIGSYLWQRCPIHSIVQAQRAKVHFEKMCNKGVVELTGSVPILVDSDQTCLFDTYISSNISGSFQGQPRHTNSSTKGICLDDI